MINRAGNISHPDGRPGQGFPFRMPRQYLALAFVEVGMSEEGVGQAIATLPRVTS